jgi:hypothetical protein
MLDDLIKGAREYISDRFMSPLDAALAASWFGWNYKFILILVSGEPVIRKLHLIRMIYQDHTWMPLLFGPTITAAIYLFLFPFPSRWVYAFTLRRRREALDTLREIEAQTPLTKEESQSLRDRFTQIETENLSEKLRLTNSLESLRDQLRVALEGKAAAEEEALRLRDSQSSENRRDEEITESGAPEAENVEKNNLTRAHHRVLHLLGGRQTPPTVSEIAHTIDQSHDVILVILSDLMDEGLAERVKVATGSSRGSGTGYRLTSLGVRYLLASP